MQRHGAPTRPGDLEAQLDLDAAVGVQASLEVQDALPLLDEEKPPLLELQLREQGRACRSDRLVPAKVRPREHRVASGDIADHDFALVLHVNRGPQLDLADMRAEGLDIGQLRRRHRCAQQRPPSIRPKREEIREPGAIPTTDNDVFVGKVRHLQQLGAADIQRLHHSAAEVDHGSRRSKPLAHASDFDHRLCHDHGPPQDLVTISP
mmetsp:Transcript_72808/g.210792  ORF Transcript_72808/g.210792 Transcript_72808/m.210792 type:complete len:207 (+) Transcript_72808:169-789(+)